MNVYETMRLLSVFNLMSTGNMSLTLKMKSLVMTQSTKKTMRIVLMTMMMMMGMIKSMKIWILMTTMTIQKNICPVN